jgi:hypothetical protein
MTVATRGVRVKRGEIPGNGEIRRLAELRDKFSGHQIIREVLDQNGGIRYCAYGVTVTIHPHTIITRDLEELENELHWHQEEQDA